MQMKSLLLVLVKSHNFVFLAKDMLTNQTNKTGIKDTLILGVLILLIKQTSKTRNKLNKPKTK